MKSRQRFASWIFAVALLGAGAAMAQSEPTLNQIYDAAKSGQMDKAQTMMQQVLVAHPNSAKAHFVQAELSARQGKLDRAREELANAEKLAPGLPFAKPEAVQHLRSQLSGQSTGATGNALTTTPNAVAPAAMAAPAPAASSFPWGIVLALGGAVIALVIVLSRKKAAAPVPSYGGGNGLSGQQGFGMANTPMNGGMNPGMNPGMGYGQQPAASGMGSRIAGGLATGLAVGAGMMAANAIGKTLMGDDEHRHADNSGNNNGNNFNQSGQNADMGGQDFGVQDGGSWDDAGGGGGGDWDN